MCFSLPLFHLISPTKIIIAVMDSDFYPIDKKWVFLLPVSSCFSSASFSPFHQFYLLFSFFIFFLFFFLNASRAATRNPRCSPTTKPFSLLCPLSLIHCRSSSHLLSQPQLLLLLPSFFLKIL